MARPDAIEYLTGKLSDRPYPGGISLPGEGGKFNTNGEVQRWPGNTFVCHVSRDVFSYAVLMELQEEVKRGEFSAFFTYLPPPSFHMTVFQGLSPGRQGSEEWPAGLAVNATRDEATALMLDQIADMTIDSEFEVMATDLYCAHSLTVCGVDDEVNASLMETRQALRAATGIRPPDFDEYVFHITLGYLIQWLSPSCAIEVSDYSKNLYREFSEDLQQIRLDPCAFCNFDSMHAFSAVRKFG